MHELAHQFGLKHCIYLQCGMNGSNSLTEAQLRPTELCPVCLRKLMISIGFSARSRYASLLEFYSHTPEFGAEAEWVRRRLQEPAP